MKSSLAPAIWRIIVLVILLLAFYLRLRYLSLFDFHIDEFFTLAAAHFVAESGQPRYPSGLFYDPGLPYTYLSGLLFILLGYSEGLGRWSALISGTLAVALTYQIGRRILGSPAIGSIAALWLALSVNSVLWGGRARATTLAQLLVLFGILFLWLGISRSAARYRVLFSLSYPLSLVSHFATIVLLPAWVIASVWLRWAKVLHVNRAFLRDALLFGSLTALALSLGVLFQPPPSVEFQANDGGLRTKFAALLGKFLQLPPDLAKAVPEYFWYFAEWPHGPIIFLLLFSLLVSALNWWRQTGRQANVGVLYLHSIFFTVLLVLILVINSHWQRTRYLVMQLQPLFLLLGAHGLAILSLYLGQWIGGFTKTKSAQVNLAIGLVLTLGISLPFFTPLSQIFDSGYLGWNRYDLAAKHAAENLEDGDRVSTMHPPVNAMYLDRNDYYLVQSSPKLILKPDGSVGDRYTGAEWLSTTDEFNLALDETDRLWLIVQEFWLFNSYDSQLQQEILWRMDKAWGEGGVWALLSRPGGWPLASEPETPISAMFENGTQLLGYTLSSPELRPGGQQQLTLFWHGDSIPHDYKVFVHLRNEDNETVVQADHFIYDAKVPSSRWPDLLQNAANDQSAAISAIRDGASLFIPEELAPGQYRLVIGFYHPESFARIGVVNDQSGESGVELRVWEFETP